MQSVSTHTTSADIHLLTFNGKPVCGARTYRNAWDVAGWPSDPALWRGAVCPRCWDQAHAPAPRTAEREVA
jgi:hypothetical protein